MAGSETCFFSYSSGPGRTGSLEPEAMGGLLKVSKLPLLSMMAVNERSPILSSLCRQENLPYQCGECSVSFDRPAALQQHVEQSHTVYNCGYRGRAFAELYS